MGYVCDIRPLPVRGGGLNREALVCDDGGGSVSVSLDVSGQLELSIRVGYDTGRGRYVYLGSQEALALADALRAAARG